MFFLLKNRVKFKVVILIYENKQDKMIPHVVWDEHKGSYINYVTLFRGEGMGWGKAKCYIVLLYIIGDRVVLVSVTWRIIII